MHACIEYIGKGIIEFYFVIEITWKIHNIKHIRWRLVRVFPLVNTIAIRTVIGRDKIDQIGTFLR